MCCPECLDYEISENRSISHEDHGESHEDTMFKCNSCGAQFPESDALSDLERGTVAGNDDGEREYEEAA